MTDKAKEQACCQRIIDAQGNYMKAMAALQSSIETGGYDHWQDVEKFAKAASEDVRRYAPSALASRPAETPERAALRQLAALSVLSSTSRYMRKATEILDAYFADHPAVAPQPKTEPCTCNAQRDGDMQWTHAPNCPRSASWQRRVAKDASAAEPERVPRCRERVRGLVGPLSDICGNLLPCPDHPAPTVTHTTTPTERPTTHCANCGALSDWCVREGGCCPVRTHTPAVTPLQAPTDEGGSDFAWLIERTDGPIPTYWDGRATQNNHGPRVTYHHDANSAVRFARQEDAERIIAWLLEGEPVVAREHGWFRATAAPSDPQPSEQEKDWFMGYLRSTPINERTVHGVWEAAWHARAEYERNHRPAIDIEDIIKHCRLSLDGKSVSLPELRKALQKATGKEKVNGE